MSQENLPKWAQSPALTLSFPHTSRMSTLKALFEVNQMAGGSPLFHSPDIDGHLPGGGSRRCSAGHMGGQEHLRMPPEGAGGMQRLFCRAHMKSPRSHFHEAQDGVCGLTAPTRRSLPLGGPGAGNLTFRPPWQAQQLEPTATRYRTQASPWALMEDSRAAEIPVTRVNSSTLPNGRC
jgi:hypothetical protein